jgi:hypothetical protein
MPAGEAAEGLLETAFDVARRYKSFGSYGSEAAAVRALHRRCSGFSKEQCRAALHRAVFLVEVATETLAKHKEVLLTTLQTPEADKAASLISHGIHRHCPDFSISTCASALSWVLYWNYL